MRTAFAQYIGAVLEWARAQGWDVHIPADGYIRTLEEQAALYAKGRSPLQIARRQKLQGRNGSVTDAAPGESPHNWGLAVDFAGRDAARLVSLLARAGLQTISWDPPHVEVPNWRDYR